MRFIVRIVAPGDPVLHDGILHRTFDFATQAEAETWLMSPEAAPWRTGWDVHIYDSENNTRYHWKSAQPTGLHP